MRIVVNRNPLLYSFIVKTRRQWSRSQSKSLLGFFLKGHLVDSVDEIA